MDNVLIKYYCRLARPAKKKVNGGSYETFSAAIVSPFEQTL